MRALLLAQSDRPDGPSWTPYAAIGIFVFFAIIIAVAYIKRRS
ncbi:hypothetical protein [Streptomyces sp. NPDC059398]